MASIVQKIGRLLGPALLSVGSLRPSVERVPSPSELGEEVWRIELCLREMQTTKRQEVADLEKRLTRMRARLADLGPTMPRADRYENIVQGTLDLADLVTYGDEEGEDSFLERAEQLVGFVEFELLSA